MNADATDGVRWDPPAAGAWTRSLRLGEWIGEPVTPLFESWLLAEMESHLHSTLHRWVGQRAPLPHHVVVNGWYFYSLNWLGPGAFARNLPGLIGHAIREPRRVAGLVPPTARHAVPLFEREWREEVLPSYRAAVSAAEAAVESVPVAELPALVDELAGRAGDYFASVAALGGAAYKLEMNLASFTRRHVRAALPDGHLPLLAGLQPPAPLPRHAVTSLDWWFPPASLGPSSDRGIEHERLVERRLAAESSAEAALAGSPRRLRSFRSLLADAQRLVGIREDQVAELTLPWPVLRRAVQRLGEALAIRGVVTAPDDAFFLTREELLTALDASPSVRVHTVDTETRRTTRAEQARLAPPLLIGRVNPVLRRLLDGFPRMVGAVRSEGAVAWGSPASPGRVTGQVRVIRGPDQFDDLVAGEVLVAPLTAPAWTPLFARAAAVVTDVGSAASHASIVAREYGIPAIVGCGDATIRLTTGSWVTVDGSTGNVEPATPP